MMKVFSAAIVLVAGLVATASAGERGASISKNTLSSLGFASMTQMSDNDGLAVRGKATAASVYGKGSATFLSLGGISTSENGYAAASEHAGGGGKKGGGNGAPSSATGKNLSYAGTVVGSIGKKGLSVNFALVVGGGTSSASAQ